MGHDFDSIAKLYRKINNSRSDLIRDLETQISSKSSHNRQHLQELKKKNDKSEKKNTENLTKMRAELNKLFDSHEHSLNSHSAKLREEIREKEHAFEQDESAVLKMVVAFKKTTMKGLDLIEYYEELKSKVHALPTVDVSHCCNTQIYMSGDKDPKTMQKLIGQVRSHGNSTSTTQLITSFKHRTTSAHTICPVSAEEAWITYYDERKFELMRPNGHRTKKVKKDTKRHSFILQNDVFLLCNEDERNILKIDMVGNKKVWMNLSPLQARFIGQALHSNILISLSDVESGSRTNASQRRVQMVSPVGEVLHTYEFGKDGATSVLISPNRVTQNYNSDVCIVNRYEGANGKWLGEVYLYYADGGLKCVYKGCGAYFDPAGICCDPLCNIICANYSDDSVHILENNGSFVKYLFTSESCVPDPISLTLQNGVLWVGSDKGEVRVYRYNH